MTKENTNIEALTIMPPLVKEHVELKSGIFALAKHIPQKPYPSFCTWDPMRKEMWVLA